jgi:hypothetical protein
MLVDSQRYLFRRIRFTFLSDRTEVEQRSVIKFLRTKKFSLSGIVAEFASVSEEQASAKKLVEY